MSGIVGFIESAGKVSSDLIDRMSDSIRYKENYRTDKWNDGLLAIALVNHRVVNHETQPIFNEDKSMFILMCGEIFDYETEKLELIQNGHKFKSENNNAEYCLHLYEEKGESAFESLNGSFCIAIYKIVTRELLLVSDRFSSYPLFYNFSEKSRLIFGTQLSSILQCPEVSRELNLSAIFEFFTFMRVLGTKTFYQDVTLLQPATILRYRDGKIHLTSYWEMKYEKT